jgi:hypothetical protein
VCILAAIEIAFALWRTLRIELQKTLAGAIRIPHRFGVRLKARARDVAAITGSSRLVRQASMEHSISPVLFAHSNWAGVERVDDADEYRRAAAHLVRN